ncbi:hypothetical protein IE985_07430 [Klebsiella pneumoniae]|nr:hypothetical protein [Klebsiella pneumoniae]
MPEPEKRSTGVRWRRWKVHGRYTQWLEKLPEQMNARTGHLDKQKELAHLNPKLRRAILGGDLLLAGAGADVYYAAL